MSEKKPRSGKAKKTELSAEKKPAVKNKQEEPKVLSPKKNINQSLNYLVVNSLTGPEGPQGIQGLVGPWGTAGTAGLNGEKGPWGTAGTAGDKGETGDTGPWGTAGTAGDKGETGGAGPWGTAGTAGVNGEKGPWGTAGTAGKNGENGINGSPGKDGTNGSNGINGSIGPQGPAGEGIEKDAIVLRKDNRSMSGYIPLDIIIAGNTKDGKWIPCTGPDIQVYRGGIAANQNDKRIYLVGGANINNDALENRIQFYQSNTNLWYIHPCRTVVPVSLVAATIYNRMLVYAGGLEQNGGLSNKAYKLVDDKVFQPLGNTMKRAVAGAAAVEFEGKLYLFGGRDSTPNATLYHFTQVFDGNSWGEAQDAPFGFTQATATVHQGQIYIFGGYKKINGYAQPMPVLRYHPASGFSIEPDTVSRMMQGSAAMLGDSIYYIGGKIASTEYIYAYNSVSYNLNTRGSHDLLPKLSRSRLLGNSATIDRKLYVMGGTGQTGLPFIEYIEPEEYSFFLHKKI